MRLEFLGTRGGIRRSNRKHRRHSALLITHQHRRVMIDCGEDWLGQLDQIAPDAILVTHGHPDHAGGLRDGAPCPVFATARSWRAMAKLPVEREDLPPRKRAMIAGLAVTAVPVVHSTHAPAVGYRIRAGKAVIFYVPDVIALPTSALAGVGLYIGDGARLVRPLIRIIRDGSRAGHTSIKVQLAWCARAGVAHAIFTHCGSELVCGHDEVVEATIGTLGVTAGVIARIAYDGLALEL